MTKITVPELLDTYDFLRANCSEDKLWTKEIGIKEWLERAVMIDGLYLFRPKQRILALMIGWPTDAVLNGEEPKYESYGEIFYSRFAYVIKSHQDKQWRESLAAMAMEKHLDVLRFCFANETEEGTAYKAFELELKSAEEMAVK